MTTRLSLALAALLLMSCAFASQILPGSGSGAAVLLFDEMGKRARAKGYRWVDLSITSKDNPDTVPLATRMGVVEYKRWQVYELGI